MSAFTPGPWKVGGVDQQIWIERADPNDACICDIVQSGLDDGEPVYTEEDEANALLISAATEMYDALRFVLTNSGDPIMERVAAAALAKADGR